MAQLAFAAVGAAIGGFIGGPTGAQIGWVGGSIIGGSLNPQNTDGPRLGDSTVQLATYGSPVPRVWGGDVVAGSILWAGPMVESATKDGGKGGPTVTSYSYSRSVAIAICQGEIAAIRRIWADAVLVYDAAEQFDESPDTALLWMASQAGNAKFRQIMTVYLGTETQTADPTIEAIEGVGDVEAYRGIAYIVLDDLPLGGFGNRVPNFRFEVSTEAEEEGLTTELEPLVVYDWIRTNVEGARYDRRRNQFVAGRPIHVRLDENGDYTESCVFEPLDELTTPATFTSFSTAAETQAADFAANTANYESGGGIYSTRFSGYYYTSRFGAGTDGLKVHISTRENYETITVFCVNSTRPPDDFADPYQAGGFSFDVPRDIDVPRFGRAIGEDWDAEYTTYTSLHSGGAGPPAGYAFTPYSQTTIGPLVLTTWASYALQIQQTRTPTHDGKSGYAGDAGGVILDRWLASRSGWRAEIPDNPDWLIDRYGAVSPNYTWEIISGTAKQLCAIAYADGKLYQQALGPVLLPADPDYSNAAFWDAAATAAIADGTMQADTPYPVVVSSYAEGTPPESAIVPAGSVLLSDIVSDLCVEAGLTTGQIDVTALTDTVLGYTRPRRMPARAAIEPLRTAYWFDAVEVGEKIVFVRRGGASVATITADDLGAGLDQAAADAIESERAQEGELPQAYTVAYRSRAANYENGTQLAQRRVGFTDQQASVELSVVLSEERAAKVAEVLLYDSWASRTSRRISLTRKWSKLVPTDVITVEDDGVSRRLRIIDKAEDSGVIALDCRDDDAAVYSPASLGAEIEVGGDVDGVPGPTAAVLLDLPLLRETDIGAGYYVAAGAFRDDWNGARLYRSLDGSAYEAVRDLNTRAVVGTCETTLGDYLGGNTIDWINFVDVDVTGGELESITVAQLLDGGNACVIGSEVLQFASATLLSAGRYRLTGFLRGRLGTEQHIGTHYLEDFEDERFVLLRLGDLYRPAIELSFIGRDIDYKGVTFGDSIVGTASQSFTWNATSLKPLSPVHVNIQGTPSGAGYNINWVRRTRIGGAWSDGADVPISETSERYRVRVLWGPTEIESTTVTTNQAVVGVGQDYTYHTIEICQLSDTVGPGFPATKDF